MSIQHMDFPSGSNGLWGYGSYSELNDADDGIYAYVLKKASSSGRGCAMIEDVDPNVTGAMLEVTANVTNNYSDLIRYVLSSTQNVVGISARVYLPSLPTGGSASYPPIYNFKDISM